MRCLQLVSCFTVACALHGAAESASAQPGSILWNLELGDANLAAQPAVGPGGTIYVHTGRFQAVSPDGSILWTQAIGDPHAPSVGPDGTVYAGSQNTVYAFSPQGQTLWTFTESPVGQGIDAGPAVGPDGNIYVIFDAPGMGAVSLDPLGSLRWSTPGFINFDGTGNTRLAVTRDGLYYGEDVVPGCDPNGLQQGIISLDLDNGPVQWCDSLSAVARPVAAPNRRAYVRYAHSVIRAYEPSGEVAWTFAPPPPNNLTVGPAIGPDNAAYFFRNGSELWRIGADGQLDWMIEIDRSGGFPLDAVINSSNEALVFGVGAGTLDRGYIQAVEPLTGNLLWKIRIPGSAASIASPGEFSPDGRVVYMPITSDGGKRLLAIQAVGEGPALGLTGSCPGSIHLTVSGATSGGVVGILHAANEGAQRIPGGHPCAGTTLGLDQSTQLFRTIRADGSGNISMNFNVPANACRRFIQSIDASTCVTTNVEPLQ